MRYMCLLASWSAMLSSSGQRRGTSRQTIREHSDCKPGSNPVVNRKLTLFAASLLAFLFAAAVAFAQQQPVSAQSGVIPPLPAHATQHFLLTHHTRDVVVTGKVPLVGRLPGTQQMRLVLTLPIRDQVALDNFLQRLYDPSSVSYRHFLTVEEFTENFGPSQDDYDNLIQFAEANGFSVAGTSRNRLNLDVTGSVESIEKVFHLTMGIYQHPSENWTFYAPDREPSVDLPFPLWHVSGLDNYSTLRPALVRRNPNASSSATTGSGPSASFLGSDMRAAYYGGTALNGSGQSLGLFELLGTDLADLTAYYTNVHQTNNVPITLKSVDTQSTSCTDNSAGGSCDDTEQTLDMTQALGMAPGLSSLVMYIGTGGKAGQAVDDAGIFNAMATAKPLNAQLSCSWYWNPADPNTDNPYFEEFAAQGQNLFDAAGDNEDWQISGSIWPSDNAYLTSVGGTDLETQSAGGPWLSETAWSNGGGGISPNDVPIPAWQVATAAGCSGCSKTYRNGPDVSANANWTFYVCADQGSNPHFGGQECGANIYGGTSFAAPMWAGYLALANQQAAIYGELPLGFINPALYSIGLGPSYDADFHDIISGSNGYATTTGYDLATGWGSPNGANLINALTRRPIVVSHLDTAQTQNEVYYLGFDSNLYRLGWDGSWGLTTATGSSSTSKAPSVAPGTGAALNVNTVYNGNEVFYLTNVGGNLHIEQLWGVNLSPTDLTQQGSGINVTLQTGPVAFFDSNATLNGEVGTDNVFYLGTDEQAHVLTWSASGKPWGEEASLDSTPGTAAALGSALSGHAALNSSCTTHSEEVFYLGTNQHVYERWRWSVNFDGWHSTDVTEANSAKPVAAIGSPLAGFYDCSAQIDAMFYVGTNQHLYELLFNTQAIWQSIDLTTTTGAPTVASGSMLTADVNTENNPSVEEVFFLDSNNHVQEISTYSTNPAGWGRTAGGNPNGDLTSSTGAGLAFPGTAMSVNVSTIDNTDHVFYVGQDENIHELWWNGSWHAAIDDNTSGTPTAPPAVP